MKVGQSPRDDLKWKSCKSDQLHILVKAQLFEKVAWEQEETKNVKFKGSALFWPLLGLSGGMTGKIFRRRKEQQQYLQCQIPSIWVGGHILIQAHN